MNMKLKKRLTYACIVASYLLSGVQYAIVFPSLNLFVVQRYGSSATMFGVIVAAYSISGFISGPVFGYIVDKKKNSRTMVILGNIPNIIGNVMYMLGISPLFLIFSRFVCGIGSGSVSAMIADITRSSSSEERTSIISILIFFQEFGLIFAPAFAIAFRKIHFYIGPFLIDKYTSPGLVMAILYLLLQIGLFFMYFNLTALRNRLQIEESLQYHQGHLNAESTNPSVNVSYVEEEESNDSLNNFFEGDIMSQASLSSRASTQRGTVIIPSVSDSIIDDNKISTNTCDATKDSGIHFVENFYDSLSSEMIENAERYIVSLSDSDSSHSHQCFSWKCKTPRKQPVKNALQVVPRARNSYVHEGDIQVVSSSITGAWRTYKNDLLRDEVVLLFGLQFISAFCQTTLETIVTPLTKELYNWSDFQNSLFFLAAGVVILVVVLLLHFLSKCLSDRTLLFSGLLSLILAYILFIVLFVPSAHPNDMKSLPYIAIGAFLDLIGLPILMVCSPSLLSKLTSFESQGFIQGIRRSCLFMGLIMGPLWGGAAVKMYYILFSVPLAALLVITVLFLLSFKRLKIPSSILTERPRHPNLNSLSS